MKDKKWTHSGPAKTVAFFLLVIMVITAAVSTAGAAVVVSEDLFFTDADEYKRDISFSQARNTCWNMVYALVNNPESTIDEIAKDYNANSNLSFEILELKGNDTRVLRPAGTRVSANPDYKFEFNSHELIESVNELESITYEVHAEIDQDYPYDDGYKTISDMVNLLYSMRHGFFVLAGVCTLLAIACFVFLMFSAGHWRDREGLRVTPLGKVPLDMLLFVLGFGTFFVFSLFLENLYYMGDVGTVVLSALLAMAVLVAGTGICMNIAVRVKLGRWWENTVIYRLTLLCLRILKAIWWGIKAILKWLVTLLLNLPLIWKTALLLIGIMALELLTFAAFFYDTSWIFIAWLLTRPVVFVAVLYLALVLRRLQRGGEALAEGDLSYQVDTKYMVWDFKSHGERLNRIAEGMTRAVEERLKSERFKTELITNVSHDIKTPLTSIVNYAELIGREETENPKIKEYTQVLLRQSERLKNLIENLVEASKASTGNVEVFLAPCEVGVLLAQAVGEYEQRLTDGNLELIVKQPEAPVKIMADGRLLWRVFDNLMNNICKYAQGGTRVYLSIETRQSEAVISFKNTSRYALDIPAEQLIERFVRNDSARSSDGNGLGLSIAQSLTELQNGRLALTVDGDLFKATLHFSTIQ